MAESIYYKISKEVGKDMRQVRKVAHHPFEFFSKIMEDPKDHRPVRFRYLGAFMVKPYWWKGLRKTVDIGLPAEGDVIYAKVPELKYGRVYSNLKKGSINNNKFVSDDSTYSCETKDIKFWVLA